MFLRPVVITSQAEHEGILWYPTCHTVIYLLVYETLPSLDSGLLRASVLDAMRLQCQPSIRNILEAQMFDGVRGSNFLDSHEAPRKGSDLLDFRDQALYPSPALGAKSSLTTSLESCGKDLFPSPTPLQNCAHPREERTAHPLPFQGHFSLPCWPF